MKPKYVTQTGVNVTVVPLDSNVQGAFTNIRPGAGVTVLGALENPDDLIASDPTVDPPAAPAPVAMVWLALPAAVNGIITLIGPYRALQFTSTSGTVVSTILQQGLQ